MNWQKIIKTLVLIIIFGLILNGIVWLITKQNIIDLAKYWIASVVQMSLTINPPTAPPTPFGASPIIPGPIIEEVPVEEIPEEVVPEEEIVPEEEVPEEISPEKIEEVPEEILPEKPKALFDVSLTIQAKYKKVYPGDDLLVLVEIIKFEPKERIDIPLHYQIRNEKEKVILDYTETMAIETRLSFLQTFNITEEAKLGKYKIILEVAYADAFVSSSDTFEIAERPLFVTPGVITLTAKEILGGLGLIFGVFLIGFISFVIFLYREFMLTRGIRKITPADLGNGALTRRTEELLREAQKILEESKRS